MYLFNYFAQYFLILKCYIHEMNYFIVTIYCFCSVIIFLR